MATFAIGDVHGNRLALDDLLSKLAGKVAACDTVVFLGDYIDRGLDSKGCIERILQFSATVPAVVVGLLGNHEDWMLRTLVDPTRHSWLLNIEAFETIASYSQSASVALHSALEAAGPRLFTERLSLPYGLFWNAVPSSHREFFLGLKTHHRTPDVLCVHGGLDPAVDDLERQSRDAFLWGTDNFVENYRGPCPVVYGHWGDVTLNSEGWPEPRIGSFTIGIDTIAHGVLTAVRFPDRQVLQSGRHRMEV